MSRCYVDMGSQIPISGIYLNTSYEGTFTTACYVNFYGNNTLGDYNDTSDITDTSSMPLLLNNQHTTSFQAGLIPTVIIANFRYVCMLVYTPSGQMLYGPVIAIQHAAGGYTNCTNGTEYSISTIRTSGLPQLTWNDAATNMITYSLSMY